MAKQAKSAYKGKFDKIYKLFPFDYLKDISKVKKCAVTTVEQLLDLDAIQEMLQVNVLTQLKRVVEKQIAFKGKKKDFINSVAALDIVQVSQQHIRLVTYTIFKEKLTTPGGVKCANLKAILRRMCLLNGLWQLNMDCKACYESGYFQAGVEYSSLIMEGIK